MAKLNVLTIDAPGAAGLNTENSGVDLPVEFAKIATNCVISSDGRLAGRKGFEAFAPTAAFTGTVKKLFETVNTDGSSEIIWSNGTKIYQGYPTVTDITAALTITDSNFQFALLEDTLFAVQEGHAQIAWQKSGATWTQQSVTRPASWGATEYPNVCLAAFGHMWVADGATKKTTVWYSEEFNGLDFSGGFSGEINIEEALIGGDRITALGAFADRLIIFCTNQILIYKLDIYADKNNAWFSLEDNIKGIGCIARDSVVNTGTDVIFLSNQGVMSFARLVQSDGELPIGDVSAQVHSDVQAEITNASSSFKGIKAVWWAAEKTYLILFKDTNIIYCFNFRNPARVVCTKWDTIKSVSSILYTKDRTLIFGGTATFFRYNNYGSSTDLYRFKYFTGYMNFQAPEILKFLKNVSFLIKGFTGQTCVIKWAFDYSDSFNAFTRALTGIGGNVAEYGVSEYNIAEYSSGSQLFDVRANVSSSGQSVQLGFEADMQGSELIVYRIEVQATSGKAY